MEGPALPKMSKALANAIEDENRRVAVDSAKKKAVSQFADYDTFKNMVSVAHLKPINQPGAKGNANLAPAWSFGVDGALKQPPSATDGHMGASLGAFPTAPPATAQDFIREWKRWCSTAETRVQYLRISGAERLGTLFKVEITSTLLAEIVQALVEFWDAGLKAPPSSDGRDTKGNGSGGCEDAAAWASEHAAPARLALILDAVISVKNAGRFSLASKLVPPKVRQGLARVLAEGWAAVEGERGRVDDARQAFGINVEGPAAAE